MKTNDGNCQVFISHQWRDKQHADHLATSLEEYAHVWMDFRNLKPGDRIQSSIDDVLKEMDLVLLVWTESAASSEGVNKEISRRLDLGVRIVPCFFQYDESGNPHPPLSVPLNDVLGVDFHDFTAGFTRIAG